VTDTTSYPQAVEKNPLLTASERRPRERKGDPGRLGNRRHSASHRRYVIGGSARDRRHGTENPRRAPLANCTHCRTLDRPDDVWMTFVSPSDANEMELSPPLCARPRPSFRLCLRPWKYCCFFLVVHPRNAIRGPSGTAVGAEVSGMAFDSARGRSSHPSEAALFR